MNLRIAKRIALYAALPAACTFALQWLELQRMARLHEERGAM